MNSIIKTLHFVPDVSAEHSLSQRIFFTEVLYIPTNNWRYIVKSQGFGLNH